MLITSAAGARLAAGLAAAGVLLLSGCGGEQEPRGGQLPPLTATSPSPSATPSPTSPSGAATSSSSTPAFPATAQGAADFVRYFYGVINRAFSTGEVAELRANSADSCESCTRLANSAEQIYSEGGRAEGSYQLIAAETAEFDDGRAEVTVVYSLTKFVQLDREDKVLQTAPAIANGQSEVTLVQMTGGWEVETIRRQSQ